MIRFRRSSVCCPICHGVDEDPRGKGVRCNGFKSDDGKYAHCSREEHAEGIEPNSAGLYAHYLAGPCKCGAIHGSSQITPRAFDNPSPRILKESTYSLRDIAGNVVAEHIRRDLEHGEKKFSWRVPGKRGEGLHGIRKDSLPLYGTELLAKAKPDEPAILAEGEKAADALKRLGFLALGTVTGAPNPPGAGKAWPVSTPTTEVLKVLAGRKIYLWPDNDPQGMEHMRQVAQRVPGPVHFIQWKGAKEPGDDAADFVARGGSAEETRAMLAAARPLSAGSDPLPEGTAELVTIRLADVMPQAVRWLWQGRIPLAKLTVLDGDPGVGKSLLTVDLAARVSRGLPMPDGSRGDLGNPAGVVLLSAEDDPADTIRPRLDAAGGDPTRVIVLRGVRSRRVDAEGKPRTSERGITLADIPALRAAIKQSDAALVVVDPVMAYLDGKTDAHVDADVRALLSPLTALAAETGAAVLVVRHLRKSGAANPIYAGGGSIGIIGAARAGLMVMADPDDTEGRRRVLAPTKSNLAILPESLAYTVEAVRVEGLGDVPRVAWSGTSMHSAADLLARSTKGGDDDDFGREQRGAIDEAADWLGRELKRGSGKRRLSDIKAEARSAGISWRTVERAKARMGVRSERPDFTGGWYWCLKDPPQSRNGSVGGLGQNGNETALNAAKPQERQSDHLAALGKGPSNGHETLNNPKTANTPVSIPSGAYSEAQDEEEVRREREAIQGVEAEGGSP